MRRIFVARISRSCVLAFAFQSQLGENAARLRYMAIPLALLAVRRRPLVDRRAARRAVRLLQPVAARVELRQGRDERAENRSYWAPALEFLHAHHDPNFRVNALDTVTHWEAVYVPEAGFPITRGWYRQDDFPENEILYSDDLNLKTYVRWLHERGVRYVLVPRDRLDYSSKREAAVATKLRFVTRRGDVSIYEAPRPVPIAPGADILRLTHEQRDPARAARQDATRSRSAGTRRSSRRAPAHTRSTSPRLSSGAWERRAAAPGGALSRARRSAYVRSRR